MWLWTLTVPDEPANYGARSGSPWAPSPLTVRSVFKKTIAEDSLGFVRCPFPILGPQRGDIENTTLCLLVGDKAE